MRIYFDNNATTQVHPEVLEALGATLRDVYGNASSIHKEGQTARRAIEDARESVARLIGASPREVVFTSGGTESNNAALFGIMRQAERDHIVTTSIEHPSVAEAVGVRNVTVIPPEPSGRVEAEAMIDAIRPETRLVTMMLANNETGVLQPVAEVARVCRERGIHLHCDAVQAIGKIDVDVNALGVDTLSMSAHKMHAPKGIGALFVRRGLTLAPYVVGGAQERRRRAGTENVPLATAFGVAAEKARDGSYRERIATLRDDFEKRLPGEHIVNGSAVPRLPNTSNVTFQGADGEGIVIALDLDGVAVSSGSACSSGRVEPSRVLLEMGLTPAEAKATVRFSISRFTTAAEIDRVVELLAEIVPRAVRS
jgi:cysteine desulfurase